MSIPRPRVFRTPATGGLRRTSNVLSFVALVAITLGPCTAPDEERSPADSGRFATNCQKVRTLEDDPIVFPSRPGASHLHDFYGADPQVVRFASVTYRQLQAAESSCKDGLDTSLYWQPTLLVGDRRIEPVQVVAYYRSDLDPLGIRPYPPGLRIVAGDPNADEQGPQALERVWWSCGRGGPPKQATPLDCTDRGVGKLTAHVVFPQCWDGHSIDSVDHRSHMAFHEGSVCPASHPVQVPKLGLAFRWQIANGEGATLSCGTPYCLHADFFNAWDQDHLTQLVQECLVAAADCGDREIEPKQP